MNKILVTGGSGLVGRYLKQIMPDAYYISSNDYDLTREREVELLFKKNKFKTVIHLAARVGGIHHNIKEPVKYFEENILMNTLILKYSYKNGVNSKEVIDVCNYKYPRSNIPKSGPVAGPCLSKDSYIFKIYQDQNENSKWVFCNSHFDLGLTISLFWFVSQTER